MQSSRRSARRPLLTFLVVAAQLAATSCGRRAGVEHRGVDAGFEVQTAAATAVKRNRAFDLVPVPVAAAVARPDRPVLTFYTPHITKGSRFDVKDLDVIVRHASFVPADGASTPARAEETAVQQHPEQGHYFNLTPIEALAIGSSYELQIVEDDAIRVLAPHRFHARVDGRTVYRLRLSTLQPRPEASSHVDQSEGGRTALDE